MDGFAPHSVCIESAFSPSRRVACALLVLVEGGGSRGPRRRVLQRVHRSLVRHGVAFAHCTGQSFGISALCPSGRRCPGLASSRCLPCPKFEQPERDRGHPIHHQIGSFFELALWRKAQKNNIDFGINKYCQSRV